MILILRKLFSSLLFAILIFQSSAFHAIAQSPDTWTQKADFPGTPRTGTVAFSIGTKGYVGTGEDSSTNLLTDFWEYDFPTNQWTRLADFSPGPRRGAVGFAISNKGYIGTGYDGVSNLLDFWQYDPALNSWTPKGYMGNSISANPRKDAVGYSIANKGYVTAGYDGTINGNRECWQFDGDSTWSKKADLGAPGPAQTWRRWATAFVIDSDGYVGCGYNFSQDWKNDFWKYNLLANTWTQKADFGGTPRSNAFGFSVNGRGYIGTGNDPYYTSDCWMYNPANNVWIQVTGYPGAIQGGIAFSIAGFGFAGLGRDSLSFRNDFWMYAPDSTIGITEPLPVKQVNLFPNPCKDKLYIADYKFTDRKVFVNVYDANGKKTAFPLAVTKDNAFINTSVLTSGVYYIELITSNQKLTGKFIRQ